MAHKVLRSRRSNMGIIYMQSWKQCALQVPSQGLALWQLMDFGTWASMHCDDNQDGTSFSWLYRYIHWSKSLILLKYIREIIQ